MTRRPLVLGLVCLCCLLQMGNAVAVNYRTQKLLEVQSTNRPSGNGAAKTQNDVNARPSYGPVNGVFSPAATKPAATTVVPVKK
jgi:hypothetical protein